MVFLMNGAAAQCCVSTGLSFACTPFVFGQLVYINECAQYNQQKANWQQTKRLMQNTLRIDGRADQIEREQAQRTSHEQEKSGFFSAYLVSSFIFVCMGLIRTV